jgi:hypothetical protein
MRNRKIRLASLTVALVLSVMSSAWAQQVRLSARKNKIINGIEAELRGDSRARANGTPIRLNAELDNINVPVRTPVAFCLLQDGVTTLIGVGRVTKVGGIPVAEVELSANDGDVVPTVSAGDVLQARQRKVAPFKTNPTCGTVLQVSAAFSD